MKACFITDIEGGMSSTSIFKCHRFTEHMCTDRKINKIPVEVHCDYTGQFLVVGFRSDSVQVCDLESAKR
jgi:hypothetical protein